MGLGTRINVHMQLVLCNIYSLPIAQFNTIVLSSDALSANDFLDHTVSQSQLSNRPEDVELNNLFDAASCADKARLLCTSSISPHASKPG